MIIIENIFLIRIAIGNVGWTNKRGLLEPFLGACIIETPFGWRSVLLSHVLNRKRMEPAPAAVQPHGNLFELTCERVFWHRWYRSKLRHQCITAVDSWARLVQRVVANVADAHHQRLISAPPLRSPDVVRVARRFLQARPRLARRQSDALF